MWTENPIFREDLDSLTSYDYIPWDDLRDSTVFITGATGLIGYTAVCALLRYDQLHDAGIKVVALVRDVGRAEAKFSRQIADGCDITFIRGSVEYLPEIVGKIDYIIHGACPTSSQYFVDHAVETIDTIVNGTKNVLDLARKKNVSGVVFLSSMEVFGTTTERRPLSENDLGYIDLSTPRSSYPEGKRFAENMCCSYASEYSVPVTAARLVQTFGPGVKYDDGRVFAYAARCALSGEDIRLNTDGSKENMYLYTADAVGAILFLLVNGERGGVYNVGNEESYCSVKEMAQTVAEVLGKGAVSVLTNCGAQDNSGKKNIYRPDGFLMMDISKLRSAGWTAHVPLGEMFRRMAECFEDEEPESAPAAKPEVYAQTDSGYEALMDQINILSKRLDANKKALDKRLDKTDAAVKSINLKTDPFKVKFKRKFKAAAKKNNPVGFLFRKALNQYRKMKRAHFRRKFSKLPLQENKVFAITFDKRYNCNLKYIVEEMLREELPLDIVWVIPANGKINRRDYPAGVRLIKYQSKEMYYEMSTAKVWLDNALNCVWDNGMKKKPGQVYINTWHGSMGIKRLNGDKHWLSRAKLCNKATDYCISNCKFEEDVYSDTFWKDVPYLRYGHARNDILFRTDLRGLRKQICARYNVSPGKKIMIYAPTFRDDGSLDWCDLDFERLRTDLEQKFGGSWVIFIRKHFKNRAKSVTEDVFDGSIIDVTDYLDMQELLAVADAGITDYSSWAYDYVLTRRPLFIYATDLDQYDQGRGFYYPLTETPFSISQNTDELSENILAFDDGAYQARIDDFLAKKECVDDGHASERIVGLIKQVTDTKSPADVEAENTQTETKQ